MNKNYYFFQVIGPFERQILCCKHQSVTKKWIEVIGDAIQFQKEMEIKLKKGPNQNIEIIQAANQKQEEIKDEQTVQQLVEEEILIEKYEKSKEKIENQEYQLIVVNEPKLHGLITITSEQQKQKIQEFQENAEKKQENLNPSEAIFQIPSESSVLFSDFKVCKDIGSGAFGKIYLVQRKDTCEIFAMKALYKKRLILKDKLRYAVSEANILKAINHPFCVKLYYAFQVYFLYIICQKTPQYLYFIMDYCQGGDLLLHLINKKTFTVNEAKFYIGELILAIEHLHDLNIIYRDLKPENILLGKVQNFLITIQDSDGHIKLTDFGLSKEGILQNELTYSFCGSPAYISPEMLKRKGVGRSADMYGIGAIMYEMLIGLPPHFDENIQKMYEQIQKGRLKVPKELNSDAKNLIEVKFKQLIIHLKCLLNPEPSRRIGINNKQEIKNHPFFKEIDFDLLLQKRYIPPRIPLLDPDLNLQDLPSFELKDQDYYQENKTVNRVKNFTFIVKDSESQKEDS